MTQLTSYFIKVFYCLIPTFGKYIAACWNEPKVGIKLYKLASYVISE